MLRTIVAFICLALLAATPRMADAQQIEAHFSADSAAIGDRFTLTLVAYHGFDSEPSFPDAFSTDPVFGDLEVLGLLSAGSRMFLAPDTRIDSVVYEVTTFALDTAKVPPLRVSFDGGSVEAMSLPLFLPMISLVPGDAASIRDMASLVEFGAPAWPYVLLGLASLVILALLYYFFVRRSPPKVITASSSEPRASPYEVALERLRRLEPTELATASEVKPYFVELSDTLRTYFEDGLGIPALERTTGELMEEFDRPMARHRMPGGVPQQVGGILRLADLVKFADLKPPPPQGRSALGEAFTALERIDAKLGQIALDQNRKMPDVLS